MNRTEVFNKLRMTLPLNASMLDAALDKIIELEERVTVLLDLKMEWQDKFWEADKERASNQAKIDELMLEYCPDDMTQDQLKAYALHQRAVHKEEAKYFVVSHRHDPFPDIPWKQEMTPLTKIVILLSVIGVLTLVYLLHSVAGGH